MPPQQPCPPGPAASELPAAAGKWPYHEAGGMAPHLPEMDGRTGYEAKFHLAQAEPVELEDPRTYTPAPQQGP
ncbi:hypothetical protein CDD83_6400 [Cordyceps sp. RAO-2017]|nr:hypothetical protein CDD83_6400 [Cordyceps sp. RAO-2017]